MAETKEGTSSRYLLEGTIIPTIHHHYQQQPQQDDDDEEEEDEEEGNEENSQEIELTLGLSLNGKFGVNPKSKKLKRSSSISDFLNPLETTRLGPTVFPWAGGQLTRTCSLPVEAEEESRKRKEMQMLRRREAKRRRSEKQRRPEIGNGLVMEGVFPPPLSQGSSGSSGVSEFESQTPPSGPTKTTEAKSPQSVQSFSEQNEHRPAPATETSNKTAEDVTPNSEVKPPGSFSGTRKMVSDVLVDMPCVSTKGDRPDGKRIEGFLYRYKKGEEVRIVCVCHGSFLTPAEFVKHAGGGDVEHPLRHIVVNPSPFL